MALEIDDKRAIIAYRLEKADAVMTEAKDNAMLKHWTLTANRLYYAVFHAAKRSGYDSGTAGEG